MSFGVRTKVDVIEQVFAESPMPYITRIRCACDKDIKEQKQLASPETRA